MLCCIYSYLTIQLLMLTINKSLPKRQSVSQAFTIPNFHFPRKHSHPNVLLQHADQSFLKNLCCWRHCVFWQNLHEKSKMELTLMKMVKEGILIESVFKEYF